MGETTIEQKHKKKQGKPPVKFDRGFALYLFQNVKKDAACHPV
jgi:hypothetical protein